MNQLFNYIAIIIFILLIAVMAFLYLRHRLITRYRDLGIIFFLLLLLFIGFLLAFYWFSSYRYGKKYHTAIPNNSDDSLY